MEGMGIVVAVGAVILDNEGRVLLGRHKPERRGFWAGKWICPGGKLMAVSYTHLTLPTTPYV